MKYKRIKIDNPCTTRCQGCCFFYLEIQKNKESCTDRLKKGIADRCSELVDGELSYYIFKEAKDEVQKN